MNLGPRKVFSTFLPDTRFDVPGDLSGALPAQQVRLSEKIVGANAASVDQRFAAHDGSGRALFLVIAREARQIEEGRTDTTDDRRLVRCPSFPPTCE